MRYLASFVHFLARHKRRIFKTGLVLVFLGLFFVALLFIYYSKDIPSPDNIHNAFIPESTKIFDRTGTVVLYDIYDEQKRTVIGREKIPDAMRAATIVVEDDNFYHHIGIDFRGILRAFITNIRAGEITQGGSTITQQFVKNALLSSERTLPRKIKEGILALELEWRYSKDEILNLYLNQVPYGSNAYGVEAAAQTFFSKPASELSIAESALLAALPQAPTYYSPYGNNQEALIARQQFVLERMLRFGYITGEEYQQSAQEELVFETTSRGIQSPHFVIVVREYLERTYGASYVQQAGLKVTTTLDTTMQRIAEEAVADQAPLNERDHNANNAALVATDPHTGQILAMVGSRDYFDIENDGNVNVTMRLRQPGSSFKPFAYSVALQKGLTPNSIVYDVPTEFNPNCSWEATQERDQYGIKCYNPQNYDARFVGPIALEDALAQSRNIPAVKILYLAGIDDTLALAKQMGIESLAGKNRFGLSLVLGGGEVTLLEETSAYGVFAARGERHETAFILRVEDSQGNVLEEFRDESKRVLDSVITDQITYMLSTNSLRAPVFGEQNLLNIPGLPAAAKTGTTQEFRDAWIVGYTPSLSVGVWVGNNDNTRMYRAPGSVVSAPIWNNFIRGVYSAKANETQKLRDTEFYFALPARADEQPFAQPSIPSTGKAILDGNVVSAPRSILYYVDRDDPRGEAPKIPKQDAQYINWETAVLAWTGFSSDSNAGGSSSSNEAPRISFLSPSAHSFDRNDDLALEVRMDGVQPISRVSASLDGELIYQQTLLSPSLSFSFFTNIPLADIPIKNFHEISVEVVDVAGAKSTKTYAFTVSNKP